MAPPKKPTRKTNVPSAGRTGGGGGSRCKTVRPTFALYDPDENTPPHELVPNLRKRDGDVTSLKMWVYSRTTIPLLPAGAANWDDKVWGDFEGVLSKKPGDFWLSLEAGKTVRCFHEPGISGKVETAPDSVPRPYPIEGQPEPPAPHNPAKVLRLRYGHLSSRLPLWQTFFFGLPVFNDFHTKTKNSLLVQNDYQKLTNDLKGLLESVYPPNEESGGDILCEGNEQIEEHSTGGSSSPPPTSSGYTAVWKPKPGAGLVVRPMNELFTRFHAGFTQEAFGPPLRSRFARLCMHLNGHILNDEKVNEESIRAQIASVLGMDPSMDESLLRIGGYLFYIVGGRGGVSPLDALRSAAKTFLSKVVNYSTDFMVESNRKAAATKRGPSGFNNFDLVKVVRFATGSDGFNEDPVPKHVYAQLKDWWAGLYEFQIREISKVSAIEVLGFSSEKTTKTTNAKDNERLRVDRAWKTALCLDHLLNSVKLPNIYEAKPRPAAPLPKPDPIDSVKIWYSAAPQGDYPIHRVLAARGDFILDLPSAVSTYEKRAATEGPTGSDEPLDRICIIVFKKEDENVTEFYQDITLAEFAFPFVSYRRIALQTSKSGDDWAVYYIVPGRIESA